MVKGQRGEETHCYHFMGYSFQLAASNSLYESTHRQDNTYNLCYTSCGSQAGIIAQMLRDVG